MEERNLSSSIYPDSIEIDPDNRIWEYDGDGKRIYKLKAGYSQKTIYKEKKNER